MILKRRGKNLKCSLQKKTMEQSPCSLCWCWRLLLEWCERKTLLAGWWLEAAVEVV